MTAFSHILCIHTKWDFPKSFRREQNEHLALLIFYDYPITTKVAIQSHLNYSPRSRRKDEQYLSIHYTNLFLFIFLLFFFFPIKINDLPPKNHIPETNSVLAVSKKILDFLWYLLSLFYYWSSTHRYVKISLIHIVLKLIYLFNYFFAVFGPCMEFLLSCNFTNSQLLLH